MGERIYLNDGSLMGTVTRRSDGAGYSVWIKPAHKDLFPRSRLNAAGEVIITEFEYWRDLNRWVVR